MQLRGKVRAVCVTDGEGLGLSCSGVIPKLEVTQMSSRGWVDKARCIFRMECYPTVKEKKMQVYVKIGKDPQVTLSKKVS